MRGKERRTRGEGGKEERGKQVGRRVRGKEGEGESKRERGNRG